MKNPLPSYFYQRVLITTEAKEKYMFWVALCLLGGHEPPDRQATFKPRLSALQTTGKLILIRRHRTGAVHAPPAGRPTKHTHLTVIDGGRTPGEPVTPPPEEGRSK